MQIVEQKIKTSAKLASNVVDSDDVSTAEFMAISAPSIKKIWDDPEDDVYNAL